jgi:hypothetical protein
MQTQTMIESLPLVDGQTVEGTLWEDGTITLTVEDDEHGVEVRLTLEQVEALHRRLGHLLYLARDAA